jgi:aspartate ammonia-lyase
MTNRTRTERDYLGEVAVPAEAYYGVQSVRAANNFPISGLKVAPWLIRAVGCVKKACALTNARHGRLGEKIAAAIVTAAEEVADLKLQDAFIVDAFHSGAGVSFHMNANEVIANRAIELLGGARGDYAVVHPNDHVNQGQSTNDVFPTSMRLAALMALREAAPKMRKPIAALRTKAEAFAAVAKSGRTHMMDAVPLTLGQEFGGYACALERTVEAVLLAAGHLKQLGIGASAVGTGVNTFTGYREEVVRRLCEITELELTPVPDLFEATQSMAPFALVSGALKAAALEMIRIGNDMRLLGSGPMTALGEIKLPALQPGSSIMPGKVNPVIPEVMAMVGFQVAGNDTAIALAVQAGQLELNVMMPVIAHNLLQSITLLANALECFAEKCVAGLDADEARCRLYAEKSPALATRLNMIVGYHKAGEVVQRALKEGRPLKEVAVAMGCLTPAQADEHLRPEALMRPED